ncbi:MAG: alpha/beta fold hydrolase [Saprospiraceae bacterium]
MKLLCFLIFCCAISFKGVGQTQNVDTLIAIGTHRLHFNIKKGSGTPILFESGNGDDASVWIPLLNSIQDSTNATLITYDRAGLGQSEIDTQNVSFQQEIKDLELGLKKLGYTDSFFLVCHSFGGFYATQFSNRNKVTGAIFIDVGLPCFMTEEWCRSFVNAIPDETWNMIHTHKEGLYYVLKKLDSIAHYMADKTFPETIPLTYIAAEEILPMVQANEVSKWKNCIKSFCSPPNHNYILAKGTSHKVWNKDPQLVVDEITKLYKAVEK